MPRLVEGRFGIESEGRWAGLLVFDGCEVDLDESDESEDRVRFMIGSFG